MSAKLDTEGSPVGRKGSGKKLNMVEIELLIDRKIHIKRRDS